VLAAAGVVGHGVDIVDVAAFSIVLSLPQHLDRYFTDRELADVGDGPDRAVRLAGRFALKEAVLKALGIGWGEKVAFTDVETLSQDGGAPTVILRRIVAESESAKGITAWLVSISHTGTLAMASAIAIRH
jgi:holo-[acyl-carrier protein] synthase